MNVSSTPNQNFMCFVLNILTNQLESIIKLLYIYSLTSIKKLLLSANGLEILRLFLFLYNGVVFLGKMHTALQKSTTFFSKTLYMIIIIAEMHNLITDICF